MSAAGSPKAAPAAAPAADIVEDIEIPDVIERLPKPDKAAHDAAIAKIDATIKSLQERTNVVRAEMDALKTGRGGYGEQIQAAKAVYAELRSAKDNLIQQRNSLTAKVKSTLDRKDSTLKTQKSLRANLRFQTEEEYDKEIQSLRHQQETRSMSLNDEKRLVKEIESLQSQKIQVRGIPDDKSEVEKANESIKEIRALQAKKNLEIDAVQEKLSAQKLKLDELYKLNDEEKKQDKFPALAKERKEIKEKLDAEFTQLKQLRADFKAANDKYYENIRLVRKKKELERKKEDERRRLEYEAKLSEYEKEMAKIHPYQDEQDLCDALTAFLEKTYAKELKEEAESNGDASAAASAAAPVALDGLKPLQRKDEEFMNFGGGKKGKKGKKEGGKKVKRDAKLSLQMAQLDAYSSIGLVPPSTVGAVSASLKAIKEKKEWFVAQTERPKKAEPVVAAAPAAPVSPTAAPAAAAKSSPKKKTGKKFNAADKSAFPTLGGGPAVEPSSPKAFGVPNWGPGMAPPAPKYSSFVTEQAADDVDDAADDN